MKMKILNLFSGTGSVTKPWREAGHIVWDVDVDSRFSPETCDDILQWDYKTLTWIPDVVWASPPCDQYAKCRTRAKTPRNLKLADSLVERAIEIIKYFEQQNKVLLWFLENGDSTMLWGRDVAKDLMCYVVLDYCQYDGPGYRKRTRIAHSPNIYWTPRPLCDPKVCKQCINGRHILSAQQGPGKQNGKRIGTNLDTCSLDTLHGLPIVLTQEIFSVCQQHIWQLL